MVSVLRSLVFAGLLSATMGLVWGPGLTSGRTNAGRNSSSVASQTLATLGSRGLMVDLELPLRLQWTFSCPVQNISCRQSHFQLCIHQVDSEGQKVVFESGIVSSPEPETIIAEPSRILQPATRYSWEVRLCINATRTSSEWSTPTHFFSSNSKLLGVVPPIWTPRNRTGQFPTFAFFRADVNSSVLQDAEIVSALVYISANLPTANMEGPAPRPPKVFAGYKLWINGQIIGLGPGRSRCGPLPCPHGPEEQIYDGYDVTDALKGGSNVTMFVSAFGLDQSSSSFPSGHQKLLVSVHLVTRHALRGLERRHVSTNAWLSWDADGVYQPEGNSGCSWYYYPHENINASALPAGTPLAPTKLLRDMHWETSPGWRSPTVQPAFGAPLVPKPTDPPAVFTQPSSSISRRVAGPGHYLFDLGKEVQGGVTLTASLKDARETTVVLILAEQLAGGGEEKTLVMYPPRTGTDPRYNWTLAATTSSQTLTMHEYNMMRYVEVFTDETVDIDLSVWAVKLAIDQEFGTAAMETSDSDLDAVWELSRYTIEGTGLDLYSDSNARQRSADCIADDVTAILGQHHTTSQMALPRYALEQMIANGPASRVDWAVLPIIGVYEYTMHTGDFSLANATLDYLLLNHSHIADIDPTTGLVPGDAALVDWPEGMMDHFVRSNTSSVAGSWILAGVSALINLCALPELAAYAHHLTELHTSAALLRRGINTLQWNGTAVCDGVCKSTPHTAFHSSIYALAFGALTPTNAAVAWNYVRGRIDPPFSFSTDRQWPPPGPSSGLGLPCGVYPAQFAIAALYTNDKDHGLSALRVLTSNATNSWVAMLRQGATMTMEMWNPKEKPNLTTSHPWASSPAYLIPRFLFGIQATSPGYATVTIKPAPGDLRKASYRLPTVRGFIGVDLDSDPLCTSPTSSPLRLTVTLPTGCVGRISVPLLARCVQEDASGVLLEVDGVVVQTAKREDGYIAVGGVGSGVHVFTLSQGDAIN